MTGLWALDSRFGVYVLAVVGAFALGGMICGWLAQLLVSLTVNQKLPRWPAWVVRTLGGGVCAWVTYLFVFGGGDGSLPGGQGGRSTGTTAGSALDGEKTSAKEGKKKDAKDDDPPPKGDTIRVEVLGDEPLRKLAKAATFEPGKRYRLQGEQRLRTLDEIQKLVRDRLANLARVEIIVYRDSPARDRPQVAELEQWAKEVGDGKRLRVDYAEQADKAPVE